MLWTVRSEEIGNLAEGQLSDQLEKGRIVYFPRCPIELPDDADLNFLRERLPENLLAKNVSYYPDAGRLSGIKGDRAVAARAEAILKSYSARVETFLHRLMRAFMAGARLGTSSFRPLEERGRNLAPHASNELVHVDAGAYGATHGDRVLRFFTNVNPTESRVWITKGSFADLYQRHAKAARISSGEGGAGVEEKWRDRAYSAFVQLASRVFPLAKVIDSSPYDRTMRKFHNYLKDSAAFQRDPTGHLEMTFPPYASWMVLTDAVSHACTSGRHALVDTFRVPLLNCRLKQHAPYQILRGSSESLAAKR
jgi:hypothetical protein